MTILFCPVCCSPMDSEDEGHVEAECRVCGTRFTVEVEPEKVARHSVV